MTQCERIDRYVNGSIKAQGPMQDDQLDGHWRWYRQDGTLMRTGHFRLGVQVGEWQTFDRDGRLVKTTNFDHAKPSRSKLSPRKAAAQPAMRRGDAPDPDSCWKLLGLAAPARRALIGAGILALTDLSLLSAAELHSLHGMGPNAIGKLAQAMAEANVRFHG